MIGFVENWFCFFSKFGYEIIQDGPKTCGNLFIKCSWFFAWNSLPSSSKVFYIGVFRAFLSTRNQCWLKITFTSFSQNLFNGWVENSSLLGIRLCEPKLSLFFFFRKISVVFYFLMKLESRLFCGFWENTE